MIGGTAQVIQSILESILIGSLYSVMALGLSLTMDVLKIPNLAHAEFITVGGYTLTFVTLIAPISLVLALPFAFATSAVLGVVSYLFVFKPLEKMKVSTLMIMVASFGLGLIIRYILYIVTDVNNLSFVQPHTLNYFSLDFFNVRINDLYLISLPIALILAISLQQLLSRTRLGRSMRALSNNKSLAVVVGVNTERVTLLSWIIAAGFAGVGGAVWGDFVGVQPELGWSILFTLFAAALIGNFKFYGTIVGAFILAFSENTVVGLLNSYAGLSLAFEPAVPLVVIFLVVLLRPQGIAGVNLKSLLKKPVETKKV